MKERKLFKYKRVLPFVTVLMFIFFLFGIIYFNNLVYILDKQSYDKVETDIIENGYDGLFAVIPRIKVKYRYNDTDFEKDVILYSSYLFNEKIDDKHVLYINKGAPDYFIFLYNYKLMKDWLYIPISVITYKTKRNYKKNKRLQNIFRII